MSQDQQRHQHLSLKLIFRKGVQTVINTYLVIFQGYQHTIATSSIHWNLIFVAVKDDFMVSPYCMLAQKHRQVSGKHGLGLVLIIFFYRKMKFVYSICYVNESII